ncbi:MAG: hypothetical protein QM736_28570 [Vicinamibacterales bacterium]
MTTAVEQACRASTGRVLADMTDGLVTAYLDSRASLFHASLALEAIDSFQEAADLLAEVGRRTRTAIRSMLESAPDAEFDDLETVSFALRALLAGSVRIVLDRRTLSSDVAALRSQLPIICREYLSAVARSRCS